MNKISTRFLADAGRSVMPDICWADKDTGDVRTSSLRWPSCRVDHVFWQ